MRNLLITYLSVLILAITMALPAAASPAVSQMHPMPASFADLVDKLSPAVVNVSTTQKVKGGGMAGMPFQDLPDSPEFEPFREFFDQFNRNQGKEVEHEVYSLGSGFIIDPAGYIVTNNHVVDEAEEVMVTLSDNSKYKAKIIGRDKKTDLALLKVEAKKDLPFVPFGDSDAMRVGDWVIAIGNPYGLGGSVTQGIISARQRSLNAGPFDDFLQTDASINRGNSGGPLFNEKGEVIGINTAIFSPSGGSIGIGFAVPSIVAKPVIAQLKEYGRTHRGWLGVKIQEVSEEAAESVGLPKTMGALVLEVSKGSPADKAGLEPGDVITAYDGKEITEMRFLPRMVAETKIGKSVSLTYWRKNASKTVDITIGELNENDEEADDQNPGKGKKSKNKHEGSQAVLGMSVAPLTAPVREELGLDAKQTGLAVVDVESGSGADKHGIRPSDVITDVNNEPVKSIEDLKSAFDNARKAGRKFALVKIVRDKEAAFVTLPTGEEKEKKKEKE
ncbi:MAG: DegQ family serine endoprotease [Pseudomonadota bacterium]|nr:DegQ family serine endoprotease [Pseudomonadota bacterium]